ncbi:lytic transglycosylase domain-containing protein [Bradyrhizobium brasilense]|nr:lytic transglycosylase domain-containing protein [Bradyrhizobium brasilense]
MVRAGVLTACLAITGTMPATAAGAGVRAPSAQRCRVTVSGDAARELVGAEAERQGFDAKLAVAVLEQESRAGLDLNSPAGARGLMQLMPVTAARYGVNKICDPAENARGGVAYLKDLTTEFGGNVLLALAAYNSGEQRVYDARGIPPLGETVRYVAAIANSYYGFENSLKGKRRGAVRSTPSSQDAAMPVSTTPQAAHSNQSAPVDDRNPSQRWDVFGRGQARLLRFSE